MSYLYQRGDLPILPPGVSTFDPRRFRRHARAAGLLEYASHAKREKEVAEHEKRTALQRMAKAEQARIRAEAEKARIASQLSQVQGRGLWARVRDVFRRKQ